MTSFDLQENIQHLQDVAHYDLEHEHDIPSMDARGIAALLEGAVESLAESSDNITDLAVFDAYRSLLKYAEHLQGTTMSKLLDSISSAFQAQIDSAYEQEDSQALLEHRAPLEMYAFLLLWFVTAAEKVRASGEEEAPAAPAPRRGKGRGGRAGGARAAPARQAEGWTWMDQIPGTLNVLYKVLRLKTQRIWTTTADRDAFIGCVTKPAYHITESEVYMKQDKIQLGVFKVICWAVKHHGHSLAAQITIMQSLQYFEHLSEHMATCITILAKEFDYPQLTDEILREIASKTFNAADTKGPRAFSRFLMKLAEVAPRAVLKQISLLLSQLDSESYPMRMALVEIIGSLIRELAESAEESNDAEQTKRQLNGLYDLLLERTLDLSSYVRTKVLSVLTRLCDLPAKFPKQRLAITRAAVDSLSDKATTVRKAAVTLLTKLVLSHPYGLMHGGFLGLKEWEEYYVAVCEELQTLQGNVGNAVERDEDEEEDEAEDDQEKKEGDEEEKEEEEEEEDGEEEDGDEEGGERRKRKKGKAKRESEDDMDVDDEEQGQDEDESMEDGDEAGAERKKKPKKKKKGRKSELDIQALNDEQVALVALESNQILQLRLKKKYYAEGLSFIRTLEHGMKTVEQLLASTNKPEVLEAIEFFRVVHEYQFDGAPSGIRKMLHLIWSKDNSSTSEDGKELKGVRSRLLECYRSLYFEAVPGIDPKQQVNRIAKNMIELTYEATLAELTSLEEMMRIMMDDEQIHRDVIGKLWQVYSSQRPLPKSQRRGAIIILGMLALAKRTIISDRVDTLVKIGLGRSGGYDLTLARYTCVALQRLNGSAKKVKGSLLDKSIRLPMENVIFTKLQEVLERPCRTKEWFGLAEQAINTVYALGERPDILCDKLIKNLTRRAFSKEPRKPASESQGVNPDSMDQDEDAPQDAPPDATQDGDAEGAEQDKDKDVGEAFELSQLLFVVGHVAIKHMVYLELVEREWKRQKHEKELAEKAAAGRNSPARGGAKEMEELDQVAGNAEDEIGERIAGVREHELLYGKESLLAVYGPMIVHICGSPHKFKNRTLRAAATLAFSKFLCVSSQFCDAHHRLLFKILETSKDASIRSNTVIALGDVAVSFSNIIDENSNELYKGLSDDDMVVKKNTLMVLTHLILNGMIKVKGQLGEMAKCLEDPDVRIADLAKLFFSELSTKDNAIYNNLPDVISHLSVGAHAVEEDAFQSTMKYIFSFIEKEKQAENIVEKLCQRFRLTDDPRQWRDIAFCLSLLPFKSERSVKKLIDGLQYYRDKLHEEMVFTRFQEILTKARQNKGPSKPDAELNEFETILEEHRRQGEEDQAFEKRVEGKKAQAKKRATRKSARKKAPTPVEEESE
ncbi:Condensin complex subunit [Steccherinum ochraceum]|uniref:Condensin complex subunit 1 n=1 Tax=Steccherinum ochraceum TaxID=92696 RepID=A0A4R0RU65_9APHY|nr:Condensin complex subunit [Steccherinum ochraceum]